jgi:hypothetical protein
MANQRAAILCTAIIALTQAGSVRLAAAQSVTIDLDQLSKVAYCLGVMNEEQRLFGQIESCDPSFGNEKICQLVEERNKASKELGSKIERFRAYVLSRTVDLGTALYAASSASSTGSIDFRSCMEEAGSAAARACSAKQPNSIDNIDCLEPPQNPLGPCRRARVCATRELPY